jgi:uncharacterized protein YjbJ (UPF0337 family)
MDENRIAGTAKKIGGNLQESVGRAAGDATTEAEGVVNQIRGTAQDVYGRARDSAAGLAGATTKVGRDTASSFERVIRDTIENQPYTAVGIALGLGWLFGRMHRPL